MFGKALLHTILVIITGGLWGIGLAIWFAFKFLAKH